MRPEFMIERSGRPFCLYAGLLDEAHQQGLSEIRTTLLQIPTNENGNVAICQSEVRTEKGVFTGIGDACPQNVARAMTPCLIRMAETRAKARALRDAVNVGMASVEEMDSDAADTSSDSPAFHPGHRGYTRSSEMGSAAESAGKRMAQPPRPFESGAGPTTHPGINTVREPSAPPHNEMPASASHQPGVHAAEPAEGGIRNGPGIQAADADAMTPAQRRMLESLARQAKEAIQVDGISRRDASRMITDLKARTGQARAA